MQTCDIPHNALRLEPSYRTLLLRSSISDINPSVHRPSLAALGRSGRGAELLAFITAGMPGADSSLPYSCSLSLRLASQQHAEYLRACLQVDEELQPAKSRKSFTVDGEMLTMYDPCLRVSRNSND